MNNPACTFDEHDPATIAAFWGNGRYLRSRYQCSAQPPTGVAKVPVALRLSPMVVEYFKATGDGWQTRVNDILLSYAEQHRT